ncbi:MAG: hypothetical protein WBN08_19410 [Thiogranum sp.]
MNPFLGIHLSGLRDAIHHRMREKESRQSRRTEILNTVERVVEGTDSRIRLVNSYEKRLQEAVSRSLEYTDDLIDQIPEAIEVSAKSFVSDAHVNAFFVNVSDLQTVFSHSSEVRQFMEDFSNVDTPQCCALLCMRKSEKTVMGVELAGELLKRDVRQTAVSFSDHRIYSPTPSEAETRQGLKQCLFGGLVTNALEHIVQLRLASLRLKKERQILQARLRRYQQNKGAAEQNAQSATEVVNEIEEIRQKLSMVEEQLKTTHPVTPQESLEQVNAVFSRPDKFVRFNECSLRLNKMGIKIDADSPQACNEIRLAEVEIGDELPRVVTLAIFPRDELLPRKEFLAQNRFS